MNLTLVYTSYYRLRVPLHQFANSKHTKVLVENGWNSKRLITEGDATIPLETTRRAFANQMKSKQRSTIDRTILLFRATDFMQYNNQTEL